MTMIINAILEFLGTNKSPVFLFNTFRRRLWIRPQVKNYSVGPNR
jgi:hypothetical protein